MKRPTLHMPKSRYAKTSPESRPAHLPKVRKSRKPSMRKPKV